MKDAHRNLDATNLCNELMISFGYGRGMGNHENSQTESVQIHEVGAGPTRAIPDSLEREIRPTENDRGRNPYFIGAWILVALSIGLGTLLLSGLVREEPERYTDFFAVDPVTGLPSYDNSNSGSMIGNLSELAPGLFLVGLSAALALLIVQGVTHRVCNFFGVFSILVSRFRLPANARRK
ncbi:hypothetical protein ACX80Z_15880 [Arthrobacter sp. TMT4-20]